MNKRQETMGRAVGAGRRTLSKEVPVGYKRTELGVIPKHWQVIDVGSLNPFVTSGSRGWARFYAETGAPFIRISNLTRQSIDLELSDLKTVMLPPQGNAEASRTQLQDGDILISITADIGIIGIVDSRVSKPSYMNQHIALIRFDKTLVCARFVAYSLASERPQRLFVASMDIGAKAGMSLLTVRKIRLALPPFPEQRAIAEALSDVDGLLQALDALIAKKRAIKQAAMQQLLTGKTRLPGFNGEWETKRLGEIAEIKTGNRNNHDKVESGTYPFFVRSNTIERINTFSYDCEAIIVPGEGGIGSIFHYINGRFDLHQRVYRISHFPNYVCGKFIYYIMIQWFGPYAMRNSVKATVDSLRLPTFQNFTFDAPITAEEQTAIAEALSDMDAEIAALEQRRDKTRAIKQGMMQQLLTGRVRLV